MKDTWGEDKIELTKWNRLPKPLKPVWADVCIAVVQGVTFCQ